MPTIKREAGGIMPVPTQILMACGTEEVTTAAAIRTACTGLNSEEVPTLSRRF